ncbi:MAG: phosphoribosyltransferase family protein [Rhodoglobus sp.]
MLATVRDALLDAWAVLMPVECAGCGADDRAICANCLALLDPSVTPRTTAGGVTVFTALRYEREVRRLILAMKEQNRTDVARALSRPLAASVARGLTLGTAIEVVAVPASRAGYRRRGYDPVSLMLRHAGVRPARVLTAARATSVQKALGVAERASNVRGSLRARMPLDGREFLLVDDVLTTGSTISEAARAVREAGGTVLGAATLAFTPKLHG